MSATLAPRAVVVSRRSELDELLGRHGTRAAAAYFLHQRGRDIAEVDQRHAALHQALNAVGAALPSGWRRGHVDRDDLSRFLFAREDIVITVGQDGLVANAAKYLDGQPVIGVDPEPSRNPGVLARFPAAAMAKLLPSVASGTAGTQLRAMAVATLDDGQRLAGLNEIYIGHETHQSARYVVSTPDGRRERHSSSGVLVGTGTGASGWCASVALGRGLAANLPAPQAGELCWFVREAWPSPATGAELTAGRLGAGEQLTLTSESERLVVFADGVEADHLVLAWGQRVTVGIGPRQLRLVTD
ncbi:NAD kinase [Allocatelliglobosispora scoriae]|uniref:NAD kinase n=1 Tax=Allocatelliglobosispora scoriae TaxID=643052 RepID=A0A841BMN6_9ACTN|nr:NAD(+)/NADH kinase [Allocatelliglobosispora scoriae]MBB5868526.1 NAD kinase [Allocatelliglobosispora scoriae]